MKADQHIQYEISCLKIPIEDFISKDDVDFFKKLKSMLTSHICRNCRNRRIQSFNEVLLTIRYFINRRKEDAWKRSIICGVCWHEKFICVNIRQMSILLEKCKSSINGSLQRLSLMVLPNKQQSVKILSNAIPYLKSHPEILQMWSVRQPRQTAMVFVPFVISNPMQVTKPIQHKIPNIPQNESIKTFNLIQKDEKNEKKIEIKNEISSNSVQIGNNINNNNNVDKLSSLFDEIDSAENVFDFF